MKKISSEMQTDTGRKNLSVDETQINKHYVKNMTSPDFTVIFPEPLPEDGHLMASLFFGDRHTSPDARHLNEEPNGIQKNPCVTATASPRTKKSDAARDPFCIPEEGDSAKREKTKQKSVPYFHVTNPAQSGKDRTFLPKGTKSCTFQIALSVVKNKNQINYAYCIRIAVGDYSMYSSEFRLLSHQKQIKNDPFAPPAVKIRKTESKHVEDIEYLKQVSRSLVTRVDNLDQLRETNEMLMTHVETCQKTIASLVERIQNIETYAYTQVTLLQLARKFDGCVFYVKDIKSPLAIAFAQLGLRVEHGKTAAKVTHVVVDPCDLTPEIVKKSIELGMVIVNAGGLDHTNLCAQLFSIDAYVINPVARLDKKRVFVKKNCDSEKLSAVLLRCNAVRVDDVSDAEFVIDTKTAFGKMFVY